MTTICARIANSNPPPPNKMLPPPPPPHRTHRKAPPPPPPRTQATTPPQPPKGQERPVSCDLKRIDLEAAIWIHGGYPQTPWKLAFKVLLERCRAETPFNQVSAAALWCLDHPKPTPPFYLDDFTPAQIKRFPHLVKSYGRTPRRPVDRDAARRDAMNAARLARDIENLTF